MKNYTSPTINVLSIIPEGVFASGASGGITPPPPQFKYTVVKWWGGHNTGHHSSPHIRLQVSNGGRCISRLTIKFDLMIKSIDGGVSTPGPLTLISSTNNTDSITFSVNMQNDMENLEVSLNNVHFQNQPQKYDTDNRPLDSYRGLSGENDDYSYINEIKVIVE